MKAFRRLMQLVALLTLVGVPTEAAAQDDLPVYRVLGVEAAGGGRCVASLALEHVPTGAHGTVCVNERTEITWQPEDPNETGEPASLEELVVGAEITTSLMSVSVDGDPTPVVVYARWIRIKRDP